MIKKILLTLITGAWLWLLFYPWPGIPRLGKLFIITTSALKIGGVDDYAETWPKNPFGESTIAYDSLGVPHIFAPTEEAAAFAIGWAQANDRLFQVEMMQRTVLGKLSEVAGERALNRDLFWRKFRFEKLATEWENQFKLEAPITYQQFEAFCAGYNAYIANMPFEKLPIEFHLLDFKPSKISPQTMYFLVRYMAYTLAHDPVDIAFSATKALSASDSLIQLYFPHSGPSVVPLFPEKEFDFKALLSPTNFSNTLSTPLSNLEPIQDYKQLGSNNWVVHGKKTKNGYPILCNDTHLEIAYPGTWYEMHIVVNNTYRHGLAIAGSPYIVSGFNKHLSWGMTNATWDLTDYYVLDWKDNNTYFVDGKPLVAASFTDTIAIKGQKPYVKTWQESIFGPLDSINGQYLATRWVGVLPSFEAKAFEGLAKAQSVQEAQKALEHFWLPAQNFVLADIKGNIALTTAGYAQPKPLFARGIKIGNTQNALYPYILLQSQLQSNNPEKGFLFSANANQVDAPNSAYLGYRFAPSHRSRRINQVLLANNQITELDMARLHADVLDLDWENLKPIIEKHIQNPKFNTILQGFDGNFNLENHQATLFYQFKERLLALLIKEIHPALPLWPLDEVMYDLCKKNDSLPNLKGNLFALSPLFNQAADSSLAFLEQKFGPNHKQWLWGKYHQSKFMHIAQIPQLSPPPIQTPGNQRTVNVSSGKDNTHGPAMRTLISMLPQGAQAQIVITGGQSGRFNSPNYNNQMKDWLQVQYHQVQLPQNIEEGYFKKQITLTSPH